MRIEKNEPKSTGMMVLSMIIFGSIGIFRRYIPFPSAMIAMIRGLMGAGLLTLFVLLRGGTLKHNIGAKKVLWLLATGAVMGFNWILLFEAYNYTSVSIATLCYYMQPVIVILTTAILFREHLSLKKGICTVTALIGMFFVSGIIESGIPQAGELKGILLGLGAALFYSIVVLMNRGAVGIDSYEKTILQLLGAGVVMIPYLLLTRGFSAEGAGTFAIVMLLIVGVFHTALAYLLYFGSMNGLKTQTVALLSYIDPLVALLLSALILGERMTVFGVIGAVLILGSAIVSELGKE